MKDKIFKEKRFLHFGLSTGQYEACVMDYPEVKDEIMFEFQLPEDTEFVKDPHWNIGRGFSDEFLEV